MTNEGVNLLRRLGSGVIPDGAASPAIGAPIEGAEFPTLLVEADAGAIRTGRAVRVDARLEPALAFGQLENLADAADLALAAGAVSVIVLIDDRALTLDVPARRITGEIPLDHPAQTARDVLAGVDAAVVARTTIAEPSVDEADNPNAVTAPMTTLMTTPMTARRHADALTQIQNRSVAELLAGHPEIRPETRRAG